MSEPVKWRCGAKLSRGPNWIWPKGVWEYDLEKAMVVALRTWPHSKIVGVEQQPGSGERWIHEQGKMGWRLEQPAAPDQVERPLPAEQWWQRD